MTKPQSPEAAPAAFTPRGSIHDIEHGDKFTPKFDDNGLIAGLVVDANTGDMLMLAWMNARALSLTIETGVAHFWSRSRQKLWRKGETSGNELKLIAMATDCDQDAILMRVEIQGNGVACHTGAKSCFYRTIEFGNRTVEFGGSADNPDGSIAAGHRLTHISEAD